MNNKIKLNENYKTVSLSPFVNKSSTFFVFLSIFIALIPQVAMLFITKSFSNLAIIATAIGACLLSELFSFIDKKNIRLSILLSFLHGTLIGFFLPQGFSLLTVFFITLVVKLLMKYAFKEPYCSWLNPVILVVISCWFIGQSSFPDFLVTKDFLSAKNPSLVLIQEGIFPTFKFDEGLTSFFNDSTFSLFGVSIPQGYISLLWDTGSVIPAFRFNLLTIIASIYFMATDIFKIQIPVVFLTIYLLLVKYLVPVFTGGVLMHGDMILALLSSGTLFCAFFMLQWFGTIPMSKRGKIFYAILGGFYAFIFSGCGTSSIGSVITILFLNLSSPLIQYFENKTNRIRILNNLRNENA